MNKCVIISSSITVYSSNDDYINMFTAFLNGTNYTQNYLNFNDSDYWVFPWNRFMPKQEREHITDLRPADTGLLQTAYVQLRESVFMIPKTVKFHILDCFTPENMFLAFLK